MNQNPESITLQLHYHFSLEDSHSMNARVHNECDRHFIQAIQLLNKYIDEPFEIIVLAREEGGIKDLYRIIIRDPLLLIILTALITSTTQRFFESTIRPTIHTSEETKNKLENVEKIKTLIQSGTLTEEEFDYISSHDRELKRLKSQFYKSAIKEEQITQIEIEAISKDNTPIFPKKAISYSDFDKCILKEEQEISEFEIDAKIYIVAPVLTKGRKDHWKGIMNGESIEFRVSDKVFLENVYQHIIKFSNGTFIYGKMLITNTTFIVDEKERIARNVIDVISWGEDDTSVHKVVKRIRKGQFSLDSYEQELDFFSDTDLGQPE